MEKRSIVFLSLFLFAECFSPIEFQNWNLFKAKYVKRYNETEEFQRMRIFLQNQRLTERHNELYEKGLVSYKMGLNTFSDLLHDEFVASQTGFNFPVARNKNNQTYFKGLSGVELPSFVDWRIAGAVTRVKNQWNCSSCWAFSAVGSLEGQYFRKTGQLLAFSEQNLVDCFNGCNIGFINSAFQFIINNGGINTEQSYPYIGIDESCKYDSSEPNLKIRGYNNIPEGDENTLKEAIATIGPISAAIDISSESFRHYASGVYNEINCNPYKLDHAVVVVGYGTDSFGKDYYIVKNSWGDAWGDGGYIKMIRNQKNQCGIATVASYPIL